MEDSAIDFIKRIGNEIKSERMSQGMMQKDMGEIAGFGRQYCNQIESAFRNKYSSTVYFKLAIALNIPLSVLVYRAMIKDSQIHLDIIRSERVNNPLDFDDIPKVISYYSQKLKEEREARGIERWKVAEQLDIISVTLDEAERFKVESPFRRYYAYAELLNIKFYDLIKEAEEYVSNSKKQHS